MPDREDRFTAGMMVHVPGSRVTSRLIFGLLIVALGVLFALDNLGIMDAGEILRWWPVALIAYGIMRVTGFSTTPRRTSGFIFIAIGGWLLLHSLGVVRVSIWELWWPMILIVIGGAMVRRALRPEGEVPGAGDASPRISSFAIWAGIERKVVTQEFRGGDLTAIMGGHEIDLRGAKMAGDSAVIDLLVLMGGVELRVPEDWRVTTESLVIMGGVEDKSKPSPDARSHLILRGLVMMGGVEIKS